MIEAFLPQIAGVLVFIASLFGVFLLGRRSKGKEDKLDESIDYIKMRKKIDDADIPSDDPDTLREWLRNRDPKTK